MASRSSSSCCSSSQVGALSLKFWTLGAEVVAPSCTGVSGVVAACRIRCMVAQGVPNL